MLPLKNTRKLKVWSLFVFAIIHAHYDSLADVIGSRSDISPQNRFFTYVARRFLFGVI